MKALFATSRVTDGMMGPSKNPSETGQANRTKFIHDQFGAEALAPVTVENIHGPSIHIAVSGDAGQSILQCDGLYTETPNLPIMVNHQDCVPIVIRDTAETFVCVLHAGWKGTLAGILIQGIKLCIERGKKVEDLQIDFGPSIQSCHFITKEDVAGKFRLLARASVVELAAGVFSVNLFAALRSQAVALGVHPANMTFSKDCTAHDPGYFSWRKDHNPEANMVTAAMLME
jgi:hypothetical protein